MDDLVVLLGQLDGLGLGPHVAALVIDVLVRAGDVAEQERVQQLRVLGEKLEERRVVLLQHLEHLGQDLGVLPGLLAEVLESRVRDQLLDLLQLLLGDRDLLGTARRGAKGLTLALALTLALTLALALARSVRVALALARRLPLLEQVRRDTLFSLRSINNQSRALYCSRRRSGPAGSPRARSPSKSAR